MSPRTTPRRTEALVRRCLFELSVSSRPGTHDGEKALHEHASIHAVAHGSPPSP